MWPFRCRCRTSRSCISLRYRWLVICSSFFSSLFSSSFFFSNRMIVDSCVLAWLCACDALVCLCTGVLVCMWWCAGVMVCLCVCAWGEELWCIPFAHILLTHFLPERWLDAEPHQGGTCIYFRRQKELYVFALDNMCGVCAIMYACAFFMAYCSFIFFFDKICARVRFCHFFFFWLIVLSTFLFLIHGQNIDSFCFFFIYFCVFCLFFACFSYYFIRCY